MLYTSRFTGQIFRQNVLLIVKTRTCDRFEELCSDSKLASSQQTSEPDKGGDVSETGEGQRQGRNKPPHPQRK